MDFKTIFEDCKSRYIRFERDIEVTRTPRDFATAISRAKEIGINPVISEIKPASPLGDLKKVDNPGEIAKQMVSGGACGISVLTEEKYFKGSLESLRAVSNVVEAPVLRKDFIFDETQVDEAYYYGADSLLLISSLLSKDELRSLIERSRKYGMEPLVEVHSIGDIEKGKSVGAKIFVINNRDKDTLQIDLNKTKVLSNYIEGIKISASGINSVEDLRFVLTYCDAALIGTALMRTENIEEKVREFVYGS
jgi:indole-3-glycerol phosphate synthase